MGAVLPEWIMKCAVAEDYQFSPDQKDWKYQGVFGEAPDTRTCTHDKRTKGKPTVVEMYVVARTGEPLYGIGKCKECGRVLWCDINLRR